MMHDPPKSILEVHHVIARRHGGSDHPSNLKALCECHHRMYTRSENESDDFERSMDTSYRPETPDLDWDDPDTWDDVL